MAKVEINPWSVCFDNLSEDKVLHKLRFSSKNGESLIYKDLLAGLSFCRQYADV